MKFLVTGASGFAGSHLLEYLKSHHGATCIGTSRTPSDNPSILRCELTDGRQVEDVIEQTRPSVIIHAAGSFSNDFETDYMNNVVAAKVILDAVQKCQKDARVVLMGSAAEYGHVSDEDNPVSEEHPLKPISVYGWCKAAQTLLAPLYLNLYGLQVMVARTFNLSGRGMSEKLFTGRVEQQIRDVKSGKSDRISVGNLDAKRDYIDIDDACVMYHAIASRGIAGEVYNVGSGTAVSMRELLHKMLAEYGLDAAIVDESQNFRPPNEVSMIYADIGKITALMNPVPAD